MRWTVGVSYAPTFRDATTKVVEDIQKKLKGERPTVVLVFVSAHHAPSYYSVPELIWDKLQPKALLGASGNSVIGDGLELEGSPGVVVVAGVLPNTEVSTFDFVEGEFPNMDGSPEEWRAKVGIPYSKNNSMLLFADPISINTQSVLEGLDFAYHGTFKSGALAAGGHQPGENALFINGEVKREGIVGVVLSGGVGHTGMISQSCRPIGDPMIVTQAHKNTIMRLGASTPLDVLSKCHEKASERDRELMADNLTIGIATNETVSGDTSVKFLMRNVTGISELEGSIVVGEMVREGQMVQFHLVDNMYAKQELQSMLDEHPSIAGVDDVPPELVLLFPCLGRGRQMFGVEGYESSQLRKKFKDVPIAGLFCNGQISTINDRSTIQSDISILQDQMRTVTHLLGYTSVTSFLTPVPADAKRKNRRRTAR